MKNIRSNIFVCFSMIFALVVSLSCDEERYLPEDNTPPGQVTNIRVKNIGGGAIIHYDKPDDNDLLYIKAEYKLDNGMLSEVKSSSYRDSLVIQGFGKSEPQIIKMYAADKRENLSEPVEVEINPLIPPVHAVYQSLEISNGFGGIVVEYKNSYKEEVIIDIMIENGGEYSSFEKIYTSQPEGTYYVRGLDSVSYDFQIYVQDVWGNSSDTLENTLKPLYEELVNRKKIKKIDLPGDFGESYSGRDIDKLFNGVVGSGDGNRFQTLGKPLPILFTIELPEPISLSRIIMWQSEIVGLYNSSNVRKFNVYGTNDPSLDGSLESWTFIREFESIKPSGLGIGSTTSEDVEKTKKGEIYQLHEVIAKYKFLRFEVTETWNGLTIGDEGTVIIEEMEIYGNPN